MTSLLNTYIDALKPVAKTFQKTATKVADLVDETLEKSQQHLKKWVVFDATLFLL